MFSPVTMRRLQAVVLARDERVVLCGLGELGAIHLTRVGADTSLSNPPDHREAIARCDRLLARIHELAIPSVVGSRRNVLTNRRTLTANRLTRARSSSA